MPILVRVAVLVAILLVPVLLALAGELLAERPEAPVLPPDPVVPRAAALTDAATHAATHAETHAETHAAPTTGSAARA